MLSGLSGLPTFEYPDAHLCVRPWGGSARYGSICERGWRVVIGYQVRLTLGGVAQAHRFGP